MDKSSSVEERLEKERAFHNVTFAEDRRASVGRFYETIPDARQAYFDLIFKDCKGQTVLEYGCGPGSYAFDLAERGANVIGIDIADVAIEMARERARELGVNATFTVMNAEALDLADRSLDKIVGSGIIHHLDLDKAFGEISRCLKPSGVAVFIEPLGHNPFINAFRRLTPKLRTDDEHPLLVGDIEHARSYFHTVNVRYFNLLAMGAGLLHGTFLFKPLLAVLIGMDKAVFTIMPFMRKWAWISVIELRDPR